jgi:hypothetical protein
MPQRERGQTRWTKRLAPVAASLLARLELALVDPQVARELGIVACPPVPNRNLVNRPTCLFSKGTIRS